MKFILGIGTALFLVFGAVPPMAAPAEEVRPRVYHLNIYPILVDTRTVPITVTVWWQRVPEIVTAADLVRDHTIWRRMYFGDWDHVPPDLRFVGLDRMLAHYRHVVERPALWWDMSPYDWDDVPQPIRSIAFMQMIEHWAAHYRVGVSFGLHERRVAERLKAIGMAESWFEHRAVHVNHNGEADLGVSQTSAYAREAIRRLHRRGAADFALADEEYFNPLLATRALVYWFEILLHEANGDLEVATRAYNQGTWRARRGAGAEYAENVERTLQRYVRNRTESESWRYLRGRLTLPSRPIVRLSLESASAPAIRPPSAYATTEKTSRSDRSPDLRGGLFHLGDLDGQAFRTRHH
jgi:hypothetical protein